MDANGQAFFADRFRQQEEARPGSMEALWAELPTSRAANPDVWDQSMKFWKENLLLSAKFNPASRFLLDIKLLKELKWNGVRWDSNDLQRVLDELLREQPARVRSAASLQEQGLLWGLGSWVTSALGWRPDPMAEDAELVVLDDLKAGAERLLARIQGDALSDTDLLMLRTGLAEKVGDQHFTAHDIDLMLAWLKRQRLCATAPYDDDTVVKFSHARNFGAVSITEKDMDMIKIVRTISDLERQLARLEIDIEKDKQRIKECVRRGQRSAAMAQLKQCKLRETHYDRRAAMRDNLNTILLECENCQTHQQVLDALRSGAAVLKSSTQGKAEEVHETMDAVADALDDHREIEQALAQGVSDVGGYLATDEELLEELEQLVRADAEAETAAALSAAPAPPSTVLTGAAVPGDDSLSEKWSPDAQSVPAM